MTFPFIQRPFRSILPGPTPSWAVESGNIITQTLFVLFCSLPVFVMPNDRDPLLALAPSSSERLDPTPPRVATS